MFKGMRGVWVAGFVWLSLGVTAWATNYTFTNIADSSGPFQWSGHPISPSINDGGTVAFWAFLDVGGEGIFTGNSGGPITTIADSSGPFEWFSSYPSINSGGTVAFMASLDDGDDGIYTGSGGPVTTIADHTTIIADESWPLTGFGINISINNGGTVAFAASRPYYSSKIFTGSGGPVTLIVDTSSDPFGNCVAPSINDAGTVAFLADYYTGERGIFTPTGSGGSVTTIATDNGPFLFFGPPSTNSGGTVAFWAFLDAGGQGIFTGSGGPVTPIADSSGSFSSFNFQIPSINSSGTVAFIAGLDAGGGGIFTGSDPVADKVIRYGDTLFGSTVVDMSMGNQGLNDYGDIAFWYRLVNGVEGIAVAHIPDLILGDTDGDGDVDADDLFNVKENFGDAGPGSVGDADGDGDTDIDDLVAVKNNFGVTQSPGMAIPGLSPVFVPEPGSVGLMGVGGVMLARRSRVKNG